MDTRTKIVEASAIPEGSARVAKGWFDVLTAEHCDLLQKARPASGRLLVLIYRETPARPAPLPARDRAQMIAALESVDLVCVCDQEDADPIAERMAADPVLDMDAAQARDVVGDVAARLRE